MNWTSAFESFALAAILALGLGRLCMALALRLRWVDRPGHRKIHRKPVPYLGGLGLFLGLVLATAGLCFLVGFENIPLFSVKSLLACLAPALAAMLLGLADDLFDLRPRYKFLGQAIFAAAFCVFCYRFLGIHVPGFAPWNMGRELAVVVSMFFMLAVANGFNMMDGSDALCLSASLTSLLAVAAAAGYEGQPHLALLALCGAGACAGILVWNRPPARVYLGDAGSQGLGFLVAALILALGRGEPGQFEPVLPAPHVVLQYKAVVACLLVGWPALEVFLTVVRRTLQGRGWGVADQGHLHHRLAVRLGLSSGKIALCAVGFNVMAGGTVLAFLADARGLALLLALGLAVLVSMGFQRLGYTRILDRDWLDARRPHFAVARHFVALQIAKLRLAHDRDEVIGLVEQSCKELGVHACRVSVRDAQGKRWVWNWSEPQPLERQHTARDRVRMAQTRSQASWSVNTQDQREPELSMNLRVAMVEFMRRVMERLAELAMESNLVRFEDLNHPPKERKASEMSIKGLRQRL